MKIFVENHGCSANLAIAERMAGKLMMNKHQLVSSPEDADVVVLNTCVVKQNTEHHMKSLIKSYSRTRKLVVTGCLTKIQSDWIQKNVPHKENVAILSPDHAEEVADVVAQFFHPKPQQVIRLEEFTTFSSSTYVKKRTNPTIGIIEISRGCLSHCTYCVVKFIRGRVKSRTSEDIVSEISHEITEGGVKEIWLTATDVGAYGKDLRPRKNVADLVESILENVEGNYRLRIGMFTYWSLRKCYDKLLDLIKKDERVYKFLHMPIQSGSNRILRAMKRVGTAEEWLEFVHRARKAIPFITIATDIIVGFPGEIEDDHSKTIDLLRASRPEIVNLSKYSDRPGTEASKSTNKVPTHVISRRSRQVHELRKKIALEAYRQHVGETLQILINKRGKKENQVIGRTNSYVPVLLNENLPLGQFVKAKIVEATPTHLVGQRA